MLKEKSRSKLWRGLSNTSIGLLTIMVSGTVVANSLSPYVNGALGTSNVQAITNSETDSTYYKSEFNSVTELVQAREDINAQVASEGAALLKNDNNALPLASGKKVTLLGMASHQPMYDIGQGAAAIGNDSQIVSYETAFTNAGLQINPTMVSFYEGLKGTYTPGYAGSYTGCGTVTVGEVPQSEYTSVQTNSFSGYGDAAIIFFERNIGEGGDLADDPSSQYLNSDGVHDALQFNNDERALISMAKSHFSKVIVLLDNSNPFEIGDLLSGSLSVDAVMWVGAVGCNGTKGIADLIVGNTSPSGGLVDTYATNNHSAPAMMNAFDHTFTNASEINNDTGEHYVVEAEGVYVGYKYYETRYEDCILDQGNANSTSGVYASKGNWSYSSEVARSFGYGLNYTTFDEKIVGAEINDDGLTVKVKVKNTGDVASKDDVQLYMQSPYTEYDVTNKVEKPFTFIGCAKTGTLAKDAEETLTITVDKELLSNYDYLNAKTYLLEKGTYGFAIGNGAHDAMNNYLALLGKTGLVDEDGTSVGGNTDMATTLEINSTTRLDKGENGSTITNVFESVSDLNSFQKDTVTYLSRNDWKNTYPVTYDNVKAEGQNEDGVDMFNELAGDTYVADSTATINFRYGNPDGTSYTAAQLIGNTDYDSEAWDLLLDQMSIEDLISLEFPILSFTNVTAGHNAGFPGMTGSEGPSGNSVGFATSATHTNTNTPYYMTSEEESNSYLANYNCSSMHQESLLAATFSPTLARRMGEIFGEDTLWCHCTGQEIGVNNHRTAYSGRNAEYFSEDGNLGYIMGYEETVGIQSKGGCAWLKHVCGNDQETNRLGLAVFSNEAAMRENQFRSTEGAFRKAGAKRYMTSFTRYGVIQAAYSTEALEDLIRTEWGCESSVNMTDMAQNTIMYGARSVVNGTDTFCSFFWGGTFDYSGIFGTAELVLSNPEMANAMRKSAKRQLYLWANSNDCNGYSSDTVFVTVTPWWSSTLLGIDIGLGVLAVGFIGLYVYSYLKKKDGKEKETE